MAKKQTSTAVNHTLGEFLFARIHEDSEYQRWSDTVEIPSYIVDNLHPRRQLRPYQKEAIRSFIWLFERGERGACQHLLFNMATGTGKTLIMACCILYLYEQGYRNFVFLVHQIQILEQARKNFTEYTFEKYLFHPDGISFHGRRVQTRAIETYDESNSGDINIMFLSTSLFYNRICEDGENRLTRENFETHDTVIFADEAHRLNVETRSNKSKTDEAEVLNWESAVIGAVHLRPGNMILEFTATVDLANRNIHDKYRDKLVYKYDFLDFNKAGYCKDVQFLYNNETQAEDQKRLLIVHAVALSQYRKILFRLLTKTIIHPVILVKSRKIADSELDRVFFAQVISELKVRDFDKLRQTKNDENQLIANLFSELENRGVTLEQFISEIIQDFAEQNTLIYNSQKKERSELLAELDHPKNRVRAIFSVNALNEGWDVLALYDIIHFDIGPDKKVSLQDIQLIGRGARYCPFSLPEDFNLGGLFGSFENTTDKRKFDQARFESARILETFFYHFVKTGMFLENLQKELMGEGIINERIEKRTITMKSEFLASETYDRGFVLVNKTEKRSRTTEEEKSATFEKILHVSSYELRARGLTNREENSLLAEEQACDIVLGLDFEPHIIKKALIRAENGFFRFENLRQHVTDIASMDQFIEDGLSRYRIQYQYEKGKEIESLTAYEKLQLLVGVILPEVRKMIDHNLPKKVGSNIFYPVGLKTVFQKQKDLYIASYPILNPASGKIEFTNIDEKAKPQTGHEKPELELDITRIPWYAYDENYGTSEEKKFVKFMNTKIESLRKRYTGCEIFLVRNELDYWIFGNQDGKRFSPDYLMFINDTKNKKLYYQCVFEVKGSHLLDKDEWKEKALKNLSEFASVSFDLDDESESKTRQKYLDTVKGVGYNEIRNIGFGFYNAEEREYEFLMELDQQLDI